MASKKVLGKGLVWKVELGGTIDIWKGPWTMTNLENIGNEGTNNIYA